MNSSGNTLGMAGEFEVVRYRQAQFEEGTATVAAEIPLTLFLNGTEIATLSCSPDDLREFATGFLFSNGFISSASEVTAFTVDKKKWLAEIDITHTPDPQLLSKRLFSSGCGKGVMFSNLIEMAQRKPITTTTSIKADTLISLMKWLQSSSPLHKSSGGVHTAALSENGGTPRIFFDDVGRHNAVDKVIGSRILENGTFNTTILLVSGRISSEILFKARRCEIPIITSLGSVTHQTILLARSMKLTIIGFARGSSFTIYSNPERIIG